MSSTISIGMFDYGTNDVGSTTAKVPMFDFGFLIEEGGAAGYANDVNGVTAANIAKINGVAVASISKVNGV